MILFRRISGHSMQPILRDGQLIIVRRTKKPTVGDIVVAKLDGREVIKQIKEVKAGKKASVYLAGGDKSHDLGWVSSDAIRGKVVFPKCKTGTISL